VPKVTTRKKFVTLEAFSAQQEGDLAFLKGEVLTIVATRWIYDVYAIVSVLRRHFVTNLL